MNIHRLTTKRHRRAALVSGALSLTAAAIVAAASGFAMFGGPSPHSSPHYSRNYTRPVITVPRPHLVRADDRWTNWSDIDINVGAGNFLFIDMSGSTFEDGAPVYNFDIDMQSWVDIDVSIINNINF